VPRQVKSWQDFANLFTAGRLDVYTLVPIFWALYNATPPILFFVYFFTKVRGRLPVLARCDDGIAPATGSPRLPFNPPNPHHPPSQHPPLFGTALTTRPFSTPDLLWLPQGKFLQVSCSVAQVVSTLLAAGGLAAGRGGGAAGRLSLAGLGWVGERGRLATPGLRCNTASTRAKVYGSTCDRPGRARLPLNS
jgi:hypothetical protein